MDREQSALQQPEQVSNQATHALQKQFGLNGCCSFHPSIGIDFACVKTSHESVFNCVYCVTAENVKQSTLIPIDQILKADKKTIFDNYPFSDRNLTNEVRQVADSPPTQEALKLNIEKYFKEFRAAFLHKLEALQTQMITKAQDMSDYSEQVISFYNKISQKTKIKEIVSDQHKSVQTKSNEIKVVFDEVLSNDAQNILGMKNSLEKLKLIQSAIDFETPNAIKDTVIRQLDKISIFLVEDLREINHQFGDQSDFTIQNPQNSKNVVSELMKLVTNKFNEVSVEQSKRLEEQLNKISFAINNLEVPQVGPAYALTEQLDAEQIRIVQQLCKDLGDNKKLIDEGNQNNKLNSRIDGNQMKLEAEDLITLISNKTNFCSEEFLEDSARVIRITSDILKQFFVRKSNIKSDEQSAFNKLKSSQLMNFSKLAFKVNQLTDTFQNQYTLSKSPEESVQLISSIIERQIVRFIESKDKPEKEEQINSVKQILVDFPVFELLPFLSQYKELAQKPLPISFTRTNYESSSEMRITTNEKGQVSFSIDAQKEGQAATQTLKKEVGYLLKLHFNKPYNHQRGQFRIALVLDSMINNGQIPSDNINGFCSQVNCGTKKIIQGQQLSSKELKSVTDSLEFRWCTSKKQFFFADQSYTNINQVNENYFDAAGTYCFGINMNRFSESDWKVTVTEFSEIDPNDVANFE